MNEAVYGHTGLACPDVKCYAVSNKMLESCGSLRDELDLCRKTRNCRHELVGCSNLHWTTDQTSSICINVSYETGQTNKFSVDRQNYGSDCFSNGN